MQQVDATASKSNLDGLWVVLVDQPAEQAEQSMQEPVLARAGNDQTFLLGFRDMARARKFVEASELEGAQPRMVVKANRGELIKRAEEHGVAGLLVDYDPETQEYKSASTLW